MNTSRYKNKIYELLQELKGKFDHLGCHIVEWEKGRGLWKCFCEVVVTGMNR